ncbi:MAG: hypothetical protein V4540_03415 [Pseudomonadota bacterium]
MKNNLPAWGIALAVCVPFLAIAQTVNTEAAKAPAQLSYQSAFVDYKPYKEAPLADWRELNASVAGAPGGTSGHAGHSMGGMKGMEMPAAAAAPASAPMRMKSMPMHDGHQNTRGTP